MGIGCFPFVPQGFGSRAQHDMSEAAAPLIQATGKHDVWFWLVKIIIGGRNEFGPYGVSARLKRHTAETR